MANSTSSCLRSAPTADFMSGYCSQASARISTVADRPAPGRARGGGGLQVEGPALFPADRAGSACIRTPTKAAPMGGASDVQLWPVRRQPPRAADRSGMVAMSLGATFISGPFRPPRAARTASFVRGVAVSCARPSIAGRRNGRRRRHWRRPWRKAGGAWKSVGLRSVMGYMGLQSFGHRRESTA